MGYLFVILAVFSNEVNGYCGKKSSGYTAGMKDALLFNSIRMAISALIAFVLCVAGGGIRTLFVAPSDASAIVMYGVFMPVFLVTWLISIKTGAYLMVSVFLMLSVIVPSLGSQILYGEMVQPTQWLGFAILVAAAIVLCSYNNKIKTKLRASDLVLLLICGLSCGLSDFAQKIFVKNNSGTPTTAFNLYTFLIAFFVLILCYLAFRKDKSTSKGMPKNVCIYVLLMAVCLFTYSFFQTMAAGYLSAAIVYPMTRGLSLAVSAIMAAVFFDEKITIKCIIGILLACAGILVINI